MNVATVKVARWWAIDTVVELAKKAGLNYDIQPTPAVALGSYDVTPLEMAGAYTMFANQGVYVKPTFVSMVRAQDGKDHLHQQARRAHGARSARGLPDDQPDGRGDAHGTAAGVRARGFNVPPPARPARRTTAGSPATPPTAVHRVGGLRRQPRARSGRRALRAAHLGRIHEARRCSIARTRDAKPFAAPDGIVTVQIDPESGMPATPIAPRRSREVYIAGTQPVDVVPAARRRTPSVTNVAGWEMPGTTAAGSSHAALTRADDAAFRAKPRLTVLRCRSRPPPAQTAPDSRKTEGKEGLFRQLLGVFK